MQAALLPRNDQERVLNLSKEEEEIRYYELKISTLGTEVPVLQQLLSSTIPEDEVFFDPKKDRIIEPAPIPMELEAKEEDKEEEDIEDNGDEEPADSIALNSDYEGIDEDDEVGTTSDLDADLDAVRPDEEKEA